jgi:hypothetical protein
MHAITISVENITLSATLNESQTAEKIRESLPIEGAANVWGDEIYFEIPVKLSQAPDARADVEVGELAYWAPGRAFCIFFGPTPASIDETPRAASPVNVFGLVHDDATVLRGVRNGARVTITKTDEK